MRTLHLSSHLELSAQHCTRDFGCGLMVFAMAGHVEVCLLLGVLDLSVDVWLPVRSAADV